MLRLAIDGALALVLFAVALWLLLWADRAAFRRKHGQAELDRFDADCARLDEQLDRPAVVVPIDQLHRKATRSRQRGGAA